MTQQPTISAERSPRRDLEQHGDAYFKGASLSLTTFAESIWSMPVDVGVHAIRYVPRPGFPVVPTPNQLHKDGESYTFIHLIRRRGITGGENLVADNDK